MRVLMRLTSCLLSGCSCTAYERSILPSRTLKEGERGGGEEGGGEEGRRERAGEGRGQEKGEEKEGSV
jgi:hypothetical protein